MNSPLYCDVCGGVNHGEPTMVLMGDYSKIIGCIHNRCARVLGQRKPEVYERYFDSGRDAVTDDELTLAG